MGAVVDFSGVLAWSSPLAKRLERKKQCALTFAEKGGGVAFSSLVRSATARTEPRKADGGAAEELRRQEQAVCFFYSTLRSGWSLPQVAWDLLFNGEKGVCQLCLGCGVGVRFNRDGGGRANM